MRMNRARYQRGLTLMELMITVAIVAILGAIAIPAYTGYISESRKVEGWNNLHAIEIAQQEYFLENSTYFEGADTTTLVTNSGGLWQPAETAETDREFSYSVVAGTTGDIATSFLAKAIGKGNNVPADVILEVNK